MFSSATAKGSCEKPRAGRGARQRRPRPRLPSPTTSSAFHVHHCEYELSPRPDRVKWRLRRRVSALHFPAVPRTVLASHQEGFRQGHRRNFTVSGVLLQHVQRHGIPNAQGLMISLKHFLKLSSLLQGQVYITFHAMAELALTGSVLPSLNRPPCRGQRYLQNQV